MNQPPRDALGAHMVIVYPQDRTPRELAALASALERSLAQACNTPPQLVRPDTTALCLLVHGSLPVISRAVHEVTDAYSHWLVVPVGTPHAAHALSSADLWLRRHCER